MNGPPRPLEPPRAVEVLRRSNSVRISIRSLVAVGALMVVAVVHKPAVIALSAALAWDWAAGRRNCGRFETRVWCPNDAVAGQPMTVTVEASGLRGPALIRPFSEQVPWRTAAMPMPPSAISVLPTARGVKGTVEMAAQVPGWFVHAVAHRRLPIPGRLYIAPAPVLRSAIEPILTELDRIEALRDLAPSFETQLRSVREYRYGDELRRVHWGLTARTHAPIVREHEPRAQTGLVVLMVSLNDQGSFFASESTASDAAAIAGALLDRAFRITVVTAASHATTVTERCTTRREVGRPLAAATAAPPDEKALDGLAGLPCIRVSPAGARVFLIGASE